MKDTIKSLVFFAFLLLPAVVFGQGSETVEERPRQPTNEGFRDDSNLVVSRSVSGIIVGIKEGILTIKTQKGKEVLIAIVKRTKFKVGKRIVDVNELDEALFAEGNAVKITYVPFEDKLKRVDKVALEIKFVEPALG